MTTPFSHVYDDVYFSASGGLAEKRHVFLTGNDLPARFSGRSDFVIAEAGFGTGLSFLAAAQAFVKTTTPAQHLHFYSFEAHPLGADDIETALAPWRAELGGMIDDLIRALPLQIPGLHRICLWGRVWLTLIYGDINDYLPGLDLSVDAWFLDGFTPAKNPAMWSDAVFTAMRDQSAQGAWAATYSSARVVKEGLARAGFTVTKTKGFGYKADMITARRALLGRPMLQTRRGQRVAVLGGGLAGTAAAHALQMVGQRPVIVAPNGLADGASGNPRGLYNPRFTKDYQGSARFYAAAFSRLHGFLSAYDPALTGWRPNGALHFLHDPDQVARKTGIVNNWGWNEAAARVVDADQASDIAGITLSHSALWLPASGMAAPDCLCRFYAEGIDVYPQLPPDDFDAVVVASGLAARDYPGLTALPLSSVRGQISIMRATPVSAALRTNLCYGGYVSAAAAGVHVLGATFQRWLSDTDVRDDDHTYVIDQLNKVIPVPLFTPADVTLGRASLRVTTPDHLPVIGAVPGVVPTYASLAHGSHGLLSSHLGAAMIADLITGLPVVLDPQAAAAVASTRFLTERIPR